MTGVRMGERALQIGLSDVRLAMQLAAKAGLSGHAAIVVGDERVAARARAAAEQSGLLVDVRVAPRQALPFGDREFDVAVVHSPADTLATLDPAARLRVTREWHRVLRAGGRLIAIDAGAPTGLSALIRRSAPPDPAYESAGGTLAALEGGGFATVRLLADREGYRFIEALRL
jgi:SAM-dependent methyltransferase